MGKLVPIKKLGLIETIDAQSQIREELDKFINEQLPNTRFVAMVALKDDGGVYLIRAGYMSGVERMGLPNAVDAMLDDMPPDEEDKE